MKNRKLSLFLALFLILCGIKDILAQSGVPIVLNEYCVSNSGSTNAETDNFGNRSDWVELYGNYSAPVNLSSYYLSNDKFNLFKWKFPTGFVLNPGQYRTVWLSGKNLAFASGVHTNFNIDQCKNQWLILSNAQGVVVDSVFIRKTKESHSRGRVDYSISGAAAWRIFTITSLGAVNSGPSYIDYAPRPVIRLESMPLATNPVTTNIGAFVTTDVPEQFVHFYLENGVPYDSVTYDCFRIYYTLNTGEYPVPGAPGTFMLLNRDSIPSTGFAHLIRAISVPKAYPATPPGISACQTNFLPSFCETNTYFTDPAYQDFSPNFGVVSLSMGLDTAWLNTSGATSPTIHVEYYDKKNHISEGYANVTRPVNEAWLTKQKGFNITIDDRKGFGCNFEGKIFNVDSLGSSERKVFPTLHLKAGDYESNSIPTNATNGLTNGTGIMDVFYQSLAAKNNLKVNPLHIKPVVVFMNGKYWGVYDLREVYDKHYENYYNQQSRDSLDMLFYHSLDGAVSYADGPNSNISGLGAFKTEVYDLAMGPTIGSLVNYNKLFSRLDKASFIDYMILNSYAMNSNLWNYNIAFAKGGQTGLPGDKWHYYLWNMPSIFNFTTPSINGPPFTNTNVSPCFVHTSTIVPSTFAGNGHRNILYNLMNPVTTNTTNGRALFQMEYKLRYQDLMNGPLKCENILKHYDYVKNLFLKEMKYHEDPATAPVPGNFITAQDGWDTLTSIYRRGIVKRCETMADAFVSKFTGSCYGMTGPYPITVDVQPVGAGTVRLNSLSLENFVWSGQYYNSTLAFKAVPTSSNYVFHHWEFKNHTPLYNAPISLDSVKIGLVNPEDVVAVFTDKLNDITMPTAFTPNGDNNNDVFRPLGSALYAKDFDMSIWNRWGQEVYRSTDPTKGWDGTSRGQDALTGVYAYVITYKNSYNESKILKGNLTLLR